ncbi:hypothetical protein RRG08_031399 [Elysia crispata]|uniref:Uncharacterized protein n=1 Tax=Elysia crispata TaxID=231223 RepID=A0AAE0ZNB9_9GAST|nr:hypothetical protein RRG08_031399 [Elysia crispata]
MFRLSERVKSSGNRVSGGGSGVHRNVVLRFTYLTKRCNTIRPRKHYHVKLSLVRRFSKQPPPQFLYHPHIITSLHSNIQISPKYRWCFSSRSSGSKREISLETIPDVSTTNYRKFLRATRGIHLIDSPEICRPWCEDFRTCPISSSKLGSNE